MDIPNTELYDCRDSENLSLESPEDAVEEFLDLFATPNCDMAALIRERSPIEVKCWRRNEVNQSWINSEAEWLYEALLEHWMDEFGDPDGDNDPAGKYEAEPLGLLKAAVKRLTELREVWQCTKVATVELDAEQVERMMREHRPEWFERGQHETT